MTPIVLGLAVLSLCLSAWAIRRDTPLDWRFAPVAQVPMSGEARFETLLDYTAETGQAHSPAIVETERGFQIIWFEGSEEAQADVDIHFAGFERQEEGWQRAASGPLVTRGALGRAMDPGQIVVTLGNTIENEAAPRGLYATVASVGGWAMASVVGLRIGPEGPAEARKLNLSPFLNRSHLVKSPMVAYADGSMALPVYFEMGATHGLLVRFGEAGRVRDTRRINGAGKPIQPMIVPLDAHRAVAFLRDFDPSHKLLLSRTENGGRSWSRAEALDVANPSSPIAALGLGDGRILMAMNDDPDAPGALRLVLSEDEGESWRVLKAFEGEGALRYPMLRRLASGEIVLSYSKGTKRGVVAHLFTPGWIAAQ